VREAQEGDDITRGQVLVAPGNMHMEVDRKRIHLTEDPPVNNVRPSVDVMMKTAAKKYKSRCIGVLLTGMGNDGAEGMKDIKKYGGKTIAESENTCVVFGMPKAAINLRIVDRIAPLPTIAKNIYLSMEE
jgi:two-component system chemotaxis response regulator CheB